LALGVIGVVDSCKVPHVSFLIVDQFSQFPIPAGSSLPFPSFFLHGRTPVEWWILNMEAVPGGWLKFC
jgi:hypothetical protein